MKPSESVGRTRMWGAVVLVAVFVVGVAVGALAPRLLIGPPPFPPMMGPIPIHALNLTPEQQEKARAIFDSYRPEIDAVLEATFPKVRAVNEKVEKDLVKILNDAQKKRFEEIRSLRPERPPLGGPPRGPMMFGRPGPGHGFEPSPPMPPPPNRPSVDSDFAPEPRSSTGEQ